MTISYEIQENLSEYENFLQWYKLSSYSTKSIDETCRWEIREALSYFLVDTKEVNHLADSIINHNVITWNKLSLVDEAKLQSRLRNLGYTLKCVDDWPCMSLRFAELLEHTPILINFKFKFFNNFYGFKNFILQYYYIILCIAGVIYYQDWWMLLISIWFSHFIWAIQEVVVHEYLEHRYILPKNKIIKHLIEYFAFIWNPSVYLDKAADIRVHQYHHKYWKGQKDSFSHNLRLELLRWTTNPPLFVKPNDKVMQRLVNEFADFPYVVKYFTEIRIFLSVLAIIIFGFKYYLFFYLIPIILRHVFQGQHDVWFLILGERDHGYIFPIGLNQSWHLYHHDTGANKHKTWNEIFGGPTWVKYFNPQYYFSIMFFKIKHAAK